MSTIKEIEEIKLYLRVDNDEENELILSLIVASKAYIENGTGVNDFVVEQYPELKEIYCLIIKILVSHWYENRTPETSGFNFHKVSFSVDNLLIQLEAKYINLKD